MSSEIVKVIEKFDADQLAREHIKATETDESFFIANVGDVMHKYKLWCGLMPRIAPDFAYKCNNRKVVAGTLAMLGNKINIYSISTTIFHEITFYRKKILILRRWK